MKRFHLENPKPYFPTTLSIGIDHTSNFYRLLPTLLLHICVLSLWKLFISITEYMIPSQIKSRTALAFALVSPLLLQHSIVPGFHLTADFNRILRIVSRNRSHCIHYFIKNLDQILIQSITFSPNCESVPCSPLRDVDSRPCSIRTSPLSLLRFTIPSLPLAE